MRIPLFASLSLALVFLGCDTAAPSLDDGGLDAAVEDAGGDAGEDAGLDAGGEDAGGEDAGGEDAGGEDAGGEDAGGGDESVPPCNFDYAQQFTRALPPPPPAPAPEAPDAPGVDEIAHVEPAPPAYRRWRPGALAYPLEDLVLPDYSDDMPLFERARPFDGESRCYETPLGTEWLDEAQAYDLYRAIAEHTTGLSLDTTAEVRSVVGLRGAYPGTLAWHGNAPDRFNDTLVLLWVQTDAAKRVLEFPVNTDTGAHDFGYHASSSLRPNRRYRYTNGWHRGYNALSISEYGYRVRDDANKNGHWDSDRNGWLPPDSAADHDREGGGHNIHMGSLDAPLGSAAVDVWSAGCQVIPGMENWKAFIGHAWTGEGDGVDYFLIDVRDMAPEAFWGPCIPDGSHACPYRIESLPFQVRHDTALQGESIFDVYNCSTANESGPEVVYLLTLDRSGRLSVQVDCVEPIDIDVHLLDGDDPLACLARDHTDFLYDITPGRYWIIADSWVDEQGTELSGEYLLSVEFSP